MSVRYRPMRRNDIRKCVKHIAAHPILGPRYGKAIEGLSAALRRTFREDYAAVTVFEESHGSKTRFLGTGMAVFVSEDFLREAKNTPSFWIGPELAKRIARGHSPLLSEDQVGAANIRGGLNLVVWHNSCYPEDFMRMEVSATVIAAFQQVCRGFQLKEIFSQADSLSVLLGARAAGGFYFDRIKGAYGSFPDLDAANFSDEPRNFGMTRELASTALGSWVASLFVYRPPMLGFSRSEQRLLLSALSDGETEEQLSAALGISLFTVKKTWRSIYDRIVTCMPAFFPSNSQTDVPSEARGKQKKQRLLAYLREHPEELRPVSRNLLGRVPWDDLGRR